MRLALVTGGADGLGREFCRRLLASKDDCVCCGDINEAKGQETAKSLGSDSGSDGVHFVRFDVSKDEDWSSSWEEAERHFGQKVYLLVNNAGINAMAGWRKNVDIMLVGHMQGVFLALEKMGRTRGGNGGRIMNVASMASFSTGMGPIECVGYNVAKWGSIALTYSFATCSPEVFESEGVKAMAICPWLARTNIIKGAEEILEEATRQRLLSPEEVGQAFTDILELDENGHVYATLPDTPLMDVPNMNQFYIGLCLLLGRHIGKSLLGLNVMRPHVSTILGVLLLIILLLLYFGMQLFF